MSDAPPVSTLTASTLKQRVLSAGAWSVAGYGISVLLRFGSSLLMTRLLAPEMFGVMAIAVIIMIGLTMFSELGLYQAAVQSKHGKNSEFLNTAWVIQILRGAMLFLIAIVVALCFALADSLAVAPRASVYASPELPYVVAVVSFTAVIQGFASTKRIEAGRNVVLGRVTLIDIVAQVFGLLCTLVWVFFDRSIWALVSGMICSSLVTTILSHVWMPGTLNRWQWDSSAFREIIHFGKWMFLASILGFFANNSDRLLLGAMVDSQLLGVYSIAFSIFSAVEQILSRVIASVTFPALGEIVRDRRDDLKRHYYRFRILIGIAANLFAGFLMVSGQPLIDLLYDRRYASAGWMLEILAAAIVGIPLQISVQCFIALARPQVLTQVTLCRLITLFFGIPIGFYLFSIPGALCGVVLSYFAHLPVIFFYKIKQDIFDWRKELLPLPAILAGLAAGELCSAFIGRLL